MRTGARSANTADTARSARFRTGAWRWEGVMLKRRGAPYQKGRTRDWLKIKAHLSQELAIVGWTPGEGTASSGIGALLLGVCEGGSLEFAGKVGTGFSAKQRKELLQEL